jgi:replicative DNA helicase
MAGEDNVTQVRSIKDLAIAVIKSIEKNYETPFALADDEDGISLRDITNHWLAPGNVVCLAAMPGVGSTAFLLGVLMSMNLEKEGVLLYSSRDPGDDLFIRLLAYLSGRDSIRLAEGRMIESDWVPVMKWTEKLVGSSLQIHGTSPRELSQVRDAIERFPRVNGDLRLVILDDFFDANSEDDLEEERENILRDLEGIAIDHNVAILFTWKLDQNEADVNKQTELRLPQSSILDKYQQFLRAIMALREDGSRHRLSLYDTDTGRCFAMQLTMLTGIGVMTD